MRINVLTIFPEMFASPLDHSIIGRARQRRLLEVRISDIRDFTTDRHRVVDDSPYGGGAGMVLKPDPLVAALEAIQAGAAQRAPVILMSPQGERLEHRRLAALAGEHEVSILCGHYEGIDERVVEQWVDLEVSIGDYVTTGGELPAMVLIDALARLLPGVVGKEESVVQDSFFSTIFDYPHYTRPQCFRGHEVPSVLLSGNHEAIRRWRRKQALKKTRQQRPELLAQAELTEEDVKLLAELDAEGA